MTGKGQSDRTRRQPVYCNRNLKDTPTTYTSTIEAETTMGYRKAPHASALNNGRCSLPIFSFRTNQEPLPT